MFALGKRLVFLSLISLLDSPLAVQRDFLLVARTLTLAAMARLQRLPLMGLQVLPMGLQMGLQWLLQMALQALALCL